MESPIEESPQENAARRFRVLLRLSALATVVLAAAAYLAIDEAAAAGVLLGGIASIVGFRLLSVRMRQLATTAPDKLRTWMVVGAYMRLIVYGLFLFAGYWLDRETLHGFFGALAGLMAARFVSIYGSLVGALRQRRTRGRDAGT